MTTIARLRKNASLTPGESSIRLGLATVGLALFIGFSLTYGNFFSSGNLITIGANLAALTIAAIGTAGLLISGHVDLSIGSMYALIGMITALVMRDTGSAMLAVLVALASGATLGFINGTAVRLLNISPIIVTLGGLAVYRGLAYVVGNGTPIYGFSTSFTNLGRATIAGLPIPVVVAIVVFGIGSFVILRTVAGLRLFAIGGNASAASLVGIKVQRSTVILYTLNGLLVGVVALLVTARLGSGTPTVGVGFELDVITAVILGGVAFNGGRGHPLGVLVGVVTLGILNAGLVFAGFASWYEQISRGALLVLALAADQITQARKRKKGGRGDRSEVRPQDLDPGQAVGGVALQEVDATEAVSEAHQGPPILSARGLTVRYGPVLALEGVDLEVRPGEVVALVGDNGAGKSTLIKVVSGALEPNEGTIEFDGASKRLASPAMARAIGIETVYQDLAVFSNLGAAHNLVLGEEPTKRMLGIVRVRDDREASARSVDRLAQLGVKLKDLNRPVGSLSGGQRQSVAIARVVRSDVKVAILDEPTAALGVTQTRNVLRLIRAAAAQGTGIIFISHDIEEIFAVADRVVVLRSGRVIHEGSIKTLTRLELVQLMAGLGPATGKNDSQKAAATV